MNSIDSKLIFFNNEIEIIWDNFQTDIQHKNASDQQKLYERFGLHFDVFENLIKSVQASSKEEECVIESENGKFYQLHVNLACEKNNIKGYILRIDNVTKERRYLNQLEEYKNSLQIAKERAEQSDKLKSTFLANMSHEIRTPLNAIIGFSDLIASTEDEDEKKQYAEIITTNSDLLLRLINDILDLSKIEAGIMPLEKFEVDFISLFDEIVNLFRLRIDNSNIDFIIEPHKYDKLIVFMDKQRFTQVVCNFLTNAIKFTKQGYIKVGYNVLQGDVLEVFVEDTGVGIEENKHNKVFRRFEKLNSFAQGTGLGLAIVKAITEVDGGEVGFDSIPGSGSRFWARKKLSIFEILPKNI